MASYFWGFNFYNWILFHCFKLPKTETPFGLDSDAFESHKEVTKTELFFSYTYTTQ